ncbi:DUF2817 domain-containing protein [Aliikangiella coralliicola]|uniref:DUF2817 domain-containing protein n=1 Tax=Aliikangiella coralliicola TaxID=2592383 RepID=A0A545UC84_9GAMM|nr:M14 family zinc carboxypeptidase [Aliikangiella coralliicola]TQV87075.1 DUF2817 domain-containing protein [Aliikangiella coralliicola]
MRYFRLVFYIPIIIAILFSNSIYSTPLVDEDFPASVRVTCDKNLCEQLKKDFTLDNIEKGFVDLYLPSYSDYQNLQNYFSYAALANESPIEILLSNQQAEINFKSIGVNGEAYHTYNSMLAEIRQLESNNSNIVKVINLGNSASGSRSVWAVKVSDNVTLEEDEPNTFITGGIHGNERPSPEVALYALNKIVNSYNSDQQVTTLVNDTQMWFIPMVNPDGHTANRRTNSNNVDLNRDYPTAWNNYQVTAAEQPETRAIINNLEARQYVAGIDLHTHGRMVMYPWAHTSQSVQDLAVFKELGNMIGRAMGGYRVDTLYNLFGRILGGSIDYEYGAHGIICLGEELGTSHSPPISTTNQLARDNYQPIVNFLSRVLKSTITGKITDANTGQAIVATIKVSQIDTGGARKDYQSESKYGRYYRILPQGNYTVTVTAPGYKSQTFNNVNTNNSNQTTLNVALVEDGDPPPPPPGDNELTNGQPVTVSAAKNEVKGYTLDVPADTSSLNFVITGGSGDADLYVKFGSAPTLDDYDCRPYKNGNEETCSITNRRAGKYYASLVAYADFSNVNLTGTYQTDTPPPPPPPGDCNGIPAWNSSTFYNLGDEVSHNGSRYKALYNVWYYAPDDPYFGSTYWEKVGSC